MRRRRLHRQADPSAGSASTAEHARASRVRHGGKGRSLRRRAWTHRLAPAAGRTLPAFAGKAERARAAANNDYSTAAIGRVGRRHSRQHAPVGAQTRLCLTARPCCCWPSSFTARTIRRAWPTSPSRRAKPRCCRGWPMARPITTSATSSAPACALSASTYSTSSRTWGSRAGLQPSRCGERAAH